MEFDYLECDELSSFNGTYLGTSGYLATGNEMIGFIATAIAVFGFTTSFIPFKFVDTGDGCFAQWVMSAVVFLTAVPIHLLRGSPTIFPVTLFGGAIWKIGNCCAAPIINTLGLAVGLLIWNTFSVLLGWASGRFGLFGICAALPSNELFNYLGIAISVAA